MYRPAFFITLAMLFSLTIHAQNSTVISKTAESPIYIEGFNYPKFDELSHFAWFSINFEALEGTEIQVIGEHYRRYHADRFSLGVQLNQRIVKKLYMLGGYQKEWDLYNGGRGNPNPDPRHEIFLGMEHQVRENILLDVKLVRPIKASNFYSMGLEGVGTRLELGTRVKF